MATETAERSPYSRKWGRINWFRQTGRIPVQFSNPRIDVVPYNEGLYGPKIQTGYIIAGQHQLWKTEFEVGYGMGMTINVNPMTDPNFRIVSYEEIESSTDLIEV